MKNLALLIMLCCSLYGWAQPSVPKPTLTKPDIPDFASMFALRLGDYIDPATAAITYIEAWMVQNVNASHDKTAREFTAMAATALVEHNSRENVNPVRQEILPLNYRGLCDGFIGGGLNRKKKVCDAKRAYILKASKVVNDFVYAGTRYKVHNGIVDQIGEKYTAIINNLRYELRQMEIEKERRGIMARIIR